MIKQLVKGIPFVDKEGVLLERPHRTLQEVVQLDILSGSGSPEGVVEAAPRRLYMDTGGSAGSILYIKKSAAIAGDRTTGWILV